MYVAASSPFVDCSAERCCDLLDVSALATQRLELAPRRREVEDRRLRVEQVADPHKKEDEAR